MMQRSIDRGLLIHSALIRVAGQFGKIAPRVAQVIAGAPMPNRHRDPVVMHQCLFGMFPAECSGATLACKETSPRMLKTVWRIREPLIHYYRVATVALRHAGFGLLTFVSLVNEETIGFLPIAASECSRNFPVC